MKDMLSENVYIVTLDIKEKVTADFTCITSVPFKRAIHMITLDNVFLIEIKEEV